MPSLRPRLQVVSEGFALVVGLVVFTIIGLWAEPALRWGLVLPVHLVLVYLLVVLVGDRTWVTTGAVVRRRWTLVPTTLPLADVTSVEVAHRGTGADLVLRASKTVRLPLVVTTLFDTRSQSPQMLRRLVDMVAGLPGGDEVARGLKAQAAHLERGGTAQTSPLASR